MSPGDRPSHFSPGSLIEEPNERPNGPYTWLNAQGLASPDLSVSEAALPSQFVSRTSESWRSGLPSVRVVAL